jgi:hypothetical protein
MAIVSVVDCVMSGDPRPLAGMLVSASISVAQMSFSCAVLQRIIGSSASR